jgi:hypothetical protein
MGLSTTYTKAETLYLLQQIDKKVVGGYKGDLRISDPAPTEVGYYMLLDVGTYTNLGGINALSGKLNFASFDGATWSKVEVAMQSGKSAYEVAVANGFVGTEAQWLASLKPAVLQTMGTSETDVMSQKAVTDELVQLAAEINQKTDKQLIITKISDFQLELTDVGNYIIVDNDSEDVSVYIPHDSFIDFEIGASISFSQQKSGGIVLIPESGVNIKSEAGLSGSLGTNKQFSEIKLLKIGVNEWIASGNVAEVDSTYFSSEYPNNDIAFHAYKRDGLKLNDKYGNDATILVPTARFGGNAYLSASKRVTGGESWDVEMKFKVDNVSGNNTLFSCGGYSVNQRGITLRVYQNKINIISNDGISTANANFNFMISDNEWYDLKFKWSGITADLASVAIGDLTLTTNQIKGWNGDSGADLEFGRYSTIYMKGYIPKIKGKFGNINTAIYPHGMGWGGYELDINQSLVLRKNLTTEYIDGNSFYIDNGFSVWQSRYNSDRYIYLPNKVDGSLINAKDIPYYTEYSILKKSIKGSIAHNLWYSKIRFQNSFFDRSNAVIWNANARGEYYDSANPKDFNINELNALTLSSYLNNEYKGMLYPKFGSNSIDDDDRQLFHELILLSTDKKGTSQLNLLKYTKDIRRSQKYINGNYYTDIDGYILLQKYNDLGGNPDENYTYFKALIDSGANVTFHGSKYDVYAIQQPLQPLSGQTLTINCEIRNKKSTIVNLTADVAVNDTVFHVDSVEGFHVGEWIGASDDNCAPFHDRKMANTGYITAIDVGAKTITINQGCVYPLTVSGQAKLGQVNSVILVENKQDVIIQGSGIINGNRFNQYNVTTNKIGIEEFRASGGITVYSSQNIEINGLTFIHALLHGITLYQSSNCKIFNVISDRNFNKNILFFSVNNSEIRNVKCTHSIYEDGIILYAGNSNIDINGAYIENNKRNGLSVNNNMNNEKITIENVVVINDEMFIKSPKTHLKNILFKGNVYCLISPYYTDGSLSNISLTDIAFENVKDRSYCFGVTNDSEVVVNNLVINNSAIPAIVINGETKFPKVKFIGGGIYNHTGNKTNINPNATVEFINFNM